MGIMLLMVLELLLIGTMPVWEYNRTWSRWPSRCLGCLFGIVATLVFIGLIPVVA